MSQNIKELICELCRQFYTLGWVSGTGGGISIREGDKIYMAPSSVQKERIKPEDVFELDLKGEVCKAPESGLKLSECHPLFMNAYQLRDAGAVIHSHSLNAMMATLLFNDTFKISNFEMLKGIKGYGAFDTLEVPIIPNTAREAELTESMREAMIKNPKTSAILVKGHGVYVWGDTWAKAKTQAECYDYLFATAVKMRELKLA